MTNNDSVFTGSIPEIYDIHLVPLLFEDYANDLAERVANLEPRTVLEIAAGSGVVTRALAPQLAPDARYTVSDLNEPMLNRAESMQEPDARITWQQADALALPFDDNSFDVVFCQFGAMFFPDRIAGYTEVLRVLKPNGKFIFNTWDGLDANEIPNIVEQTAAAIFPENPPRFLSRTPYGYFDEKLITTELKSAGFSQFALAKVDQIGSSSSAKQAATAICMGSPFATEIEALNSISLDQFVDRTAEAIEIRFGSGTVSGKMSALVIAASQ